MSASLKAVEDFMARGQAIRVLVAEAFGSTPREAGTFMLVSAAGQLGTIGGGQLEFLAIDHARKLLGGKSAKRTLDIPLGPGIGQCCGGRVILQFTNLDGPNAADLTDGVRAARAAQAPILVFGAGHVGRALAVALAPLPYRTRLVDTRRGLMTGLPDEVETVVTPMPEALVRQAPAGAAFVAVTHDHALDFLIAGEALGRQDAAYVGMIGSKTKRAQFRRWFIENGGAADALSRLSCPIGGGVVLDKLPEIIAALTVAEIIGKTGRKTGALPHVEAHARATGEG